MSCRKSHLWAVDHSVTTKTEMEGMPSHNQVWETILFFFLGGEGIFVDGTDSVPAEFDGENGVGMGKLRSS